MTERQLIDVIKHYYAEKKEIFLQVIFLGGFRDDIINPSDGPRKIYGDFVQHCRGLDKPGWKGVFASLFKDKPGCAEFRDIANSEAETFDEVLSSIETLAAKIEPKAVRSGVSENKDTLGQEEKSKEMKEPEREPEAQHDIRLGKRCMKKIDVDSMLGIAVAPKLYYPVCRHPAVTNAAGIAVARIALRAFSSSVGYLRNLFDVRIYEMLREDDFILETLDEFLRHLNRPRAVLFHITDVSRPASSRKGQGIFTMTLRELTSGKILYKGIIEVRKSLEADIVRSMNKLRRYILRKEGEIEKRAEEIDSQLWVSRKRKKIHQEEKEDWDNEKEDKIKSMLKEKAEKLLVLRRKCDALLEESRSFMELMRDDWDSDMKKLRDDENCSPRNEQNCPIPF